MNTMHTIIVIIQVLSALTIIGLVLLQHGKGADMGAAFGSGASGSLFGATGSSNFLSKSTGFAAAIFFGATLMLAYLGNNRVGMVGGGVMDNLPATPAKTAPVVPGAATSPSTAVPASQAPAAVTSTTAVVVPKSGTGTPAAATPASSGVAPAPVPAGAGSGQANQIPK